MTVEDWDKLIITIHRIAVIVDQIKQLRVALEMPIESYYLRDLLVIGISKTYLPDRKAGITKAELREGMAEAEKVLAKYNLTLTCQG